MSLLLLFNSLGVFAADTSVQDDVVDSSLTENAASSAYPTVYLQSRMGKYYSDYDDASCYDSASGLKNRANCYGYAFRMFYAMNSFPDMFDNFCYLQQPGEFAMKYSPIQLQLSPTETYSVFDYSDILTLNNKLFGHDTYSSYSMSYKFNAIYTLVSADAATLGYTLTEYTGETIPDAITNRNQRLVAIVAGPKDYHFYMQHSDDTWTHKGGWGTPTNICYDHEYVLTNDNIKEHACEGEYYSGGIVKFYYITKNAIIDYSHRDGTASTCTMTRPITSDLAGSHRYAALDIEDFPEDYQNGNIDYPGDVDYFSIYTSYEETRTVHVETSKQYTMLLQIYKDGTLVASQSGISNVSVTVDFDVDSLYYIMITSTDYIEYDFYLDYEFW